MLIISIVNAPRISGGPKYTERSTSCVSVAPPEETASEIEDAVGVVEPPAVVVSNSKSLVAKDESITHAESVFRAKVKVCLIILLCAGEEGARLKISFTSKLKKQPLLGIERDKIDFVWLMPVVYPFLV